MAVDKELLFSCLVMTLLSVAPCRPVNTVIFREHLKSAALILCDLTVAERHFRDFMFTDRQINISAPPEGINWPVNSSKNVQQSVCAILDYLGNHMPQIISIFTDNNMPDNMMARINAFETNFKLAARRAALHTAPPHCVQTNVTLYDNFKKKVDGLNILHFSRRWVEESMNSTCLSST